MEEPICEANRRLGLSYINISPDRQRFHLGKMVGENLALVLFDKIKSNETMVTLWNIKTNQALTSEDVPVGMGMLWDWDWRAEKIAEAFERLCPAAPDHDQENAPTPK